MLIPPIWRRKNVIASNFIRMCSIKWIVADIYFLSDKSILWFNKKFLWYQGKDSNICCYDYHSMYITICTYTQLRNLDKMENTWIKSDAIVAYRSSCNVLPTNTKKKKGMQHGYLFELMQMQMQIRKHNGWCRKGISVWDQFLENRAQEL